MSGMKTSLKPQQQKIRSIHTLGPEGTNCELAALKWFEQKGYQGDVFLYSTLEQALENVHKEPGAAMLGCVVYPKLHELVFSNLDRLELVECFIVPTYNMILAARTPAPRISSVITHPAPATLAKKFSEQIYYSNSNGESALECANGRYDACITTYKAAERHQLKVVENFGSVSMGFTLHTHK